MNGFWLTIFIIVGICHSERALGQGRVLYWVHCPDTGACTVQPTSNLQCVPCGDQGEYYFSEDELFVTGNGQRYSGTSAGYPVPGPIVSDPVGESKRMPGVERDYWNLTGGAGSWFFYGPDVDIQDVCDVANGDCDWVAQIDFKNNSLGVSHGEAVAWTIRLMSNEQVPVVLYPLVDALAFPDYPASDAHLLIRLCNLAQLAADLGESSGLLPKIVNMSFGRSTELVSGDTEMADHVRVVLDTIAGSGILLVAAAGNHQALLFPAEDPNVLAVDRLDLHRFTGNNDRPIWQNPPGYRSRMPGDGLVLEHNNHRLALPAGSSFAAAILSGVLTFFDQETILQHGTWLPILDSCDGAFPRFLFKKKSEQLGNEHVYDFNAFNLLMARVSDQPTDGMPPDNIIQPLSISGEFPTGYSLPDIIAHLIPGPDANPCLSCSGEVSNEVEKTLRISSMGRTRSVVVQLDSFRSAQEALTDSGFTLKAINLGIRGVDTAEALRGFELLPTINEDLGQLAFLLPSNIIRNKNQFSLIFELANGAGETYWTSSTINIPGFMPLNCP